MTRYDRYTGECSECTNTFDIVAEHQKLNFTTPMEGKAYIRWKCRCGQYCIAEKNQSVAPNPTEV